MLPSHGPSRPASLSTSVATLLLFLSLPLLATPTPDQYGTVQQHHEHEPSQASQLHHVQLQSTGFHPSQSLLPLNVQTEHQKPTSRYIRDTHSETLHPLTINQQKSEELLNNNKEKLVSDLQVGCADGSLDVNSDLKEKLIKYEGDDDVSIDDIKSLDKSLQNYDDDNSEDNNIPLVRFKRQSEEQPQENNRHKRDFIRWYRTSTYHSHPSQQTFISSYHLQSRIPYVIPVWGSPSRIPVFFPYRPVLFNPGYPVQNPPTNFRPDVTTASPPPTTQNPTVTADGQNVSIGNRINVDSEGNPIWGVIGPEDAQSGNPNQLPGASGRPRKPPTPSLFHRPSVTEDETLEASAVENALTTRRPPPIPQTTPAPQAAPPAPQAAPPAATGPSRCVWAVISCCSPLNTNIRYSCFEQLGCPGSFWDRNPCSREITAAAINAAQRFYDQQSTR